MSNRPVAKNGPGGRPPKRRGPAGGSRPAATTARTAARSPEPETWKPGGDSRRGLWIAIGAVTVVVVAVIVVLVATNSSDSSSSSKALPAADELVAKVTAIKASVFDAVGSGTASGTPIKISPAAPPLTQDGKPHVVYIGAEYCPYCATERWAMVLALSRFGTFSNLGVTHSSSTDVYPDTPTFSFHGSTFTSDVLAFTGRETQSNVPANGSYAPLDTLSAAEQALIETYDAAPYVSSDSAGSIPFIDIGGKYLVSGATYSPDVLQGKTADQIAAALKDPSSDIAKGAIGAANNLTAAICKITANKPAAVCTSSAVAKITAQL